MYFLNCIANKHEPFYCVAICVLYVPLHGIPIKHYYALLQIAMYCHYTQLIASIIDVLKYIVTERSMISAGLTSKQNKQVLIAIRNKENIL